MVQDKALDISRFDRTILVWMDTHHSSGVTQIARILAFLGSPMFVVGIAVVGTIIGFVWRKVRGAAWTFPLAVVVAGLLIEGIKLTVHRPRPTVFTPLLHATGYSFPSGHSLISIVVYGLLGYFLMHLVRNRAAKLAIAILTGVFIFLIGASRVYVGVHYPSDVLAGWAAGLPWMISCLGLHEVMARRWHKAGEPILAKPVAWDGAVDKAAKVA